VLRAASSVLRRLAAALVLAVFPVADDHAGHADQVQPTFTVAW